MSKIVNAVIKGTGSYTPQKVLSNFDLEKIVETSDDWIFSRTGIRERRIAGDSEATSDMCYQASLEALEMAGVSPEDLDMIIIGTVTPDYPLPSTATLLQAKLGAKNSGAFDIVAACAGFLHSMAIGKMMITEGNMNRILVVGAEVLSRITDYRDRATCVLFGDGAGAAVLERQEADIQEGVLSSYLKADGTKKELLWIPVGGTKTQINSENFNDNKRYINMNGNEVYKLAVRAMCDAANRSLASAGLTSEDIDWLIPHQANIRIIDGVAKRLNVPKEKVYLNIEKYGNTSAASVPIALDEANRKRLIKKGDNILMVAFGGGLTWAASLVKW